MTCRAKGCTNTEVAGSRYCEHHLCSRTIRGNRCRNKKWMNTPFCFLHQYSGGKLNIMIWILGVVVIPTILIIVAAIFGPKLYYIVFGSLEIDFKENDIFIENNKPYAKIEVLNQLGYPLLFVNGTATFKCQGLFGPVSFENFRLEGNHDFLASGASAEFLLSPDPFLIDLVKTRDQGCSDVNFFFAKYVMINETNAELKNVESFGASGEKDIQITRQTYNYSESTNLYSCEPCEIIIQIYASNVEKPFSKKEYASFVGSIKMHPFQKYMLKPSYVPSNINEFFNSRIFYSLDTGPCKGVKEHGECANLLCKQIPDISCDQMGGYQPISRVPIFPLLNPELASEHPK